MADLKTRLGEALMGDTLAQMREGMTTLLQEVEEKDNNLELFQERMAELELALEDVNWMRVTLTGEEEFSRRGLQKICDLARLMFIKNPLIKRQVLVQALYVWAQGITVRAKDKRLNAVLQAFWDDEKNRSELTSHGARFQKDIDLAVDGNLFFVFFTRPTDGRVRVRTIPTDEIYEIISNPQDAKSPWYYHRKWSEKQLDVSSGNLKSVSKQAYYPDWRYKPTTKPTKIGKWPVQWDSPIYHVKSGGLAGWKFGVSEVYASIDWARAYKEFLEDWSSLTRAYSRFAWKLTTRGGKKGVAAAKAKLGTTLGTGSEGIGIETNPPPVTASTAIIGEGHDLEPMQLRGANVSAEDGRRLLLMVAASAGLPETYFGDVSVGTLATGKTLDRPTELMMRNRQTMWMDVLHDIIMFVITAAANASDEPLKDVATVMKTSDNGELEEVIQWSDGVDPHLDIDFPPILERDVLATIQSIVEAVTLNGKPIAIFDEPIVARLLLSGLAQDDVDELMTALYPDETASVDSTSKETASADRMKAAILKLAEAFKKADGK
jgi:hypothetical protein